LGENHPFGINLLTIDDKHVEVVACLKVRSVNGYRAIALFGNGVTFNLHAGHVVDAKHCMIRGFWDEESYFCFLVKWIGGVLFQGGGIAVGFLSIAFGIGKTL